MLVVKSADGHELIAGDPIWIFKQERGLWESNVVKRIYQKDGKKGVEYARKDSDGYTATKRLSRIYREKPKEGKEAPRQLTPEEKLNRAIKLLRQGKTP